MERKLKILQSFTISCIVTIIFITAVTVASELSHPLKDLLKNTFTHHWIGKSIISVGLFLVIGLLLLAYPLKPSIRKATSLLRILFIFSVIGFLIILGFYLYEGLIK